MKKYAVTIRTTITKTYEIEAENEDAVAELAYEVSSVLEDGTPENYEEDILSIKEL